MFLLFFFGLISSNFSPLKPHVFGRSFFFFFVIHVCNDGASNLRLHVVFLPASVTMWWPAKITWKLNMSGLDFLALVLQKSNSFILVAFFMFYPVYFILVTKAIFNYCISGPCVQVGVFERSRCLFLLFFCLISPNFSPLKPHVFGRSFVFCNLCL